MIRIAKKEDKEQIIALYKQLHKYHCEIAPHKHIMPREEFFEERTSEILADENSLILVNEDMENYRINAYALFRIIDVNSEEKAPRRVCFIDCFAVAEGARRKGIGSLLFNAVKRFGREQGCNAVQLGVNAENSGAIKFYKKMGLTPRTYVLTEEI